MAGLWLLALAIAVCVYFPKIRTAFLIVAVVGLIGFGFSTFALSYQVINDRYGSPGHCCRRGNGSALCSRA